MTVMPHLSFKGQCEAAFRFYEQALGGKIVFMTTYGQTPVSGQIPADWQDKVIHATLEVGSQKLTGADAPPEHYRTPQGFSLTLDVDDPGQAERVFAALAEKGNRADADRGNILGLALRNACRSV